MICPLNRVVLVLMLTGIAVGCEEKGKKSAAADGPVRAGDTVTSEPQEIRFPKGKQKLFPNSPVARAVGYSFLDIHDYEFDSSERGQLLKIMPEYHQYVWKKDRHPKVLLDRLQATQLLAIINDPGTYSATRAECNFPRNCFIFYDEHDEIVGWYEVCFECGVITSIPEFAIDRNGGLTETGEKKMKAFCRSAGINIGFEKNKHE